MLPKSSQNFVVKFKKSGPANLTIVISKKIAKRAVDRNRIKRITREAIKKIDATGNLVLIVKNNIAGFKMGDVYDELKKILKV